MNDVLSPFLRRFVLVFFNDILIFSGSSKEHLRHVYAILDVLHQHRLFVKQSKCEFGATSIAYLGHTISAAGDSAKVQAVTNWPQPCSVHAVRNFLGMAGYYRKFVKDYGTIAAPLTALLCKEGFSWTEVAGVAFNDLKAAITSALVLALPVFTIPYIIERRFHL